MTVQHENNSGSSSKGQIDDSARRKFLQMIGAGTALAATGFHGSLLANPGLLNAAQRGGGGGPAVSPWRSDFILDRSRVFMNIGTAGSMPRKVVQAYNEANIEKAKNSLNGYGNYADIRQRIAPGFGVGADECALSYNTTDGMCSAVLGIPWKEGDVIVTTNHEHPGGNSPMAVVAAKYGVEIRRVSLPVGPDVQPEEIVQLFQDKINEGGNVRALVWSSPTFLTGTMLPIRRLVDLAIQHGLISICDGAHLPGMMNYDYGALGVDFMSGAGHKWQCGPGATGILVVRNRVGPNNPLPLPAFFPVSSAGFGPSWVRGVELNATPNFDVAAVLCNIGSRNRPSLEALADACDMWDEIGRQEIEDYILGLSRHLKQSIADRWGRQALVAPDHPELLSALTAFNPFISSNGEVNPKNFNSSESGNFVSRLANDYGFIVRNTSVPVPGIPNQFPLRVSTHLWHSQREVDQFVDAAWQLANELS